MQRTWGMSRLPVNVQLMIYEHVIRDRVPSAHYFTAPSGTPLPLLPADANGNPPTQRAEIDPAARQKGQLTRCQVDKIEVGLSAPQPSESTFSPYPRAAPGRPQPHISTLVVPAEVQDNEDEDEESSSATMTASSSSSSSSGNDANSSSDTDNANQQQQPIRRVRATWTADSRNSSIYHEDSALWTLCKLSRYAMLKHFGRYPDTAIRMVRTLEARWAMGPAGGKSFRQVLDAHVPGPRSLALPPVMHFRLLSVFRRQTQYITITPGTDLLIVQPQPRPSGRFLTNDDRQVGLSLARRRLCECDLTKEAITPGMHGRETYTGLEGGKCAAYQHSALIPLLDPRQPRQDPIFPHMAMVFANDSHLVQIPGLPSWSRSRPTVTVKGWQTLFQRHLVRMLSALTDGRGIQNFWMVDYRLKYVVFEHEEQPTEEEGNEDETKSQTERGSSNPMSDSSSSSSPSAAAATATAAAAELDELEEDPNHRPLPLPLAARQTFKTREFDLVELVPEDIPSMDLMRLVHVNFQTRPLLPDYELDTHALGALTGLLAWQAEMMGKMDDHHTHTHPRRHGTASCPNLATTRFRVLGLLVREPRGAGWKRGPSGGNVYFEQ